VRETIAEKKRGEAAHRETVMDLNGKINERDAQLSQARQVSEKLKEREKQLNADIQSNLKTMQALDAELATASDKHARLKKHSQELALQIDNLKISKEQQALKIKEHLKVVAELEAQAEALQHKLAEKDAELAKVKSSNNSLKN